MHGPDPSWCARLHATHPPRPTVDVARPPLDAARLEAERSTTEAPAGDVGSDCSSPDAPTLPSSDGAPLPQGSPYVYRDIPSVHECELCGTVMYDHNCKIVCPNCGYKRDCSDP